LVLIVLPTLCFCRSSATLELEATTLAATANKLSLSAGWDVRALLKHLQSGIKHLEWAHSFAGSGGVGVASISKQQAYKNNLAHAADLVQQCADLTKKAIAQDKQRKAQGAAGHQGVVIYAFAALRMLADKLYAVAQMNLLFVKTQVRAQKAVQGCSRACAEVCCVSGLGGNLQHSHSRHLALLFVSQQYLSMHYTDGHCRHCCHATFSFPAGALQGFNTTLRNLNNNTSAAATAAVAAAAAAAVVESAGGAGAAGTAAAAGPGIMAAPAARAPGGSRGRAGGGLAGGPSMGESGTQNSASSAVELAPLAPEGSSRTQDRLDLGQGVLDYISLTEHWASVALYNEEYLKRTGRQKAIALQMEERTRARADAAAAAAAVVSSTNSSSANGAAVPADAAAGVSAAAGGGGGSEQHGDGHCSAAALSDAHRIGQLILAVGFEAGMWDLPSVLDIARQAADAIGNLVEEHSTPGAVAAAAANGIGSGAAPVAVGTGA
jgi:hypothetical protein